MKTKSKTRREATPEQKEAAKIRREGIANLCKLVKNLPEEKRVQLANAYGIRNCEGRELSPFNQCLLVHQLDTVSIVGGFAQWRALGRCVKKGSKALAIWVPCTRKAEAGPEAIMPAGTDPASLDERFFTIGNVFDITATETEAEREARENETPALPAPPLALPYRADAIDIDAEPVTADTNHNQLVLS